MANVSRRNASEQDENGSSPRVATVKYPREKKSPQAAHVFSQA